MCLFLWCVLSSFLIFSVHHFISSLNTVYLLRHGDAESETTITLTQFVTSHTGGSLSNVVEQTLTSQVHKLKQHSIDLLDVETALHSTRKYSFVYTNHSKANTFPHRLDRNTSLLNNNTIKQYALEEKDRGFKIKFNPKIIPPSLYSNFLLNSEPCTGRDITLLIAVTVRRNNTEGRTTIRQTWGASGTNRTGPVALLFFMGRAKPNESPLIQNAITEEFEQHQDIIQGDYIDDYKNLTLKSLQVVKWASMYCRHASYILKADDDVYVNLAFLVRILNKKSLEFPNKPFIVGCVIENAYPIRNISDKWYISWDEYPEVPYPRYLNGGCGYAMTGSAAFAIRHVIPKVPFLKMEDVYVTGLCAEKANVAVIGVKGFSKNHVKVKYMYTQVTAGDYFNYQEFRQIYRSFMQLGIMHRVWVSKQGMNDLYQTILGIPKTKLLHIHFHT